MPANLIAGETTAGERFTRPYITVADLRQVLAGLPDDAVILTFDDETGEFEPYPHPLIRDVQVFGSFLSTGGFVYFDLERPDDPSQPDPLQTFEGIVL